MNEQELRDKIIGIVSDVSITGIKIRGILGGEATANAIADALIAANIGDVSEWKHRAEVAERAVRELAVQVGCKSYPFYCRCGIDSPNAKNDYQECYEAILRQAEKELQEERKDD